MSLSLRSPRFIVLLLACLLPLSAVAHGQDHEHPVDTGHQVELGADAAFGPHGRLWVATVHDGHVLLRHSDDFGKTLGQPVEVNAVAENIDANRENAPKIALGANGQIYVSWSHPLEKKWASQVRFARSLDGGKTFSTPITVDHGPQGLTHSFNSMAVAGNGDVVVAWLDARDMAADMAAGKPHRGLSVYYSWSSDSGKTFAPDRKVMYPTCECCRIALAREPDGTIATLFRGIYGNNIRDHAFAVLHTGNQPEAPQRATFSGWRIAACPEQGPSLAIGADGVRHAVWYEASHGPTIWYGQIDPGHPPRHKLKIGGPGAGHADVAVQGSTVWVTWNQVDAEGYTLMLRTSHDNGVHFGPEHAIATSTAAVDSPHVLLHDGTAYVAWNTANGFRLVHAEDK